MEQELRSLLDPKKVHFLKKKLLSGEITSEDCQEVLKRLMLREYERVRAERFQEQIRKIPRTLKKEARNFLKKLMKIRKPPKIEPSLSAEELMGAARPRHL